MWLFNEAIGYRGASADTGCPRFLNRKTPKKGKKIKKTGQVSFAVAAVVARLPPLQERKNQTNTFITARCSFWITIS